MNILVIGNGFDEEIKQSKPYPVSKIQAAFLFMSSFYRADDRGMCGIQDMDIHDLDDRICAFCVAVPCAGENLAMRAGWRREDL